MIKRFLTLLGMLALTAVVGFSSARADDPVGDPSGTQTGTIADTGLAVSPPADLADADKKDADKVKTYDEAKKASDGYAAQAKAEPLAVKLADTVGHNKISINLMWTLLCGFLVMFMQAGFAIVEGGLTRGKNIAHTMTMNMMVYPLGMLGFYVCGFAFMFGGVGALSTLGNGTAVLNHEITVNLFGHPFGLLGWSGFCLSGTSYDVGVFALFLFQMVFMDTTATIPTGAAAERWKFSAFVVYGCLVGSIMYPIFGNWVWGGGWLATLGTQFGLGHGHVDFAGSSVVHMQGGVIALVFAWLIGPRIGKFNKDGSANPMPAHNIPMAILGTIILAFCWFGFNAGSTTAGTDLRISVVAVNTMLASATAAMATMLWMWFVRTKKPDPSMCCNGLLAGLVAITAPCAFVNSTGACIIGIVAGILVVESVFFFDKLRIDDPVGAISVHGVNGAWGCLALGLFADGKYGDGYNGVTGNIKGLFYDGGMSQFYAELIGVVTCFVVVAIIAFIVYKVIDIVIGHRVSAEIEIEGLDVPEMGVVGYNGVVLDKAAETPVSK